MDIKTAAISFCNSSGAIVAAFGNRITPDRIPDGQTYPCGRVSLISTDQRYHFRGESGRKVILQIDTYDSTLTGADTNTELIRSAFSGYKGMVGSINAGMVTARIVFSKWSTEIQKYHRIVEIIISTSDQE